VELKEARVYGPGGETSPLDLMDNHAHGPNPWPLYDWLLENAPLYQDSNGIWYVSRYDDVAAVAMNPGVFTSEEGNRPLIPPDHSFIHLDGDKHRQRRALIQKYFAPRPIKKLEDHVREVVTGLIDEVIEDGSCDFVDKVAAPLPNQLICEMTGVPPEYYGLVRRSLDVFVRDGEGPWMITEDLNEAFFDFGNLHLNLMAEREDERRNDFLSLWMDAVVQGKPMNEDEILFEHAMLMVGGSETTRNAITGGLYMLCQHPEQRARLLSGEASFDNAAEEIIRWTSPFVSMSRVLRKDFEMHGQQMKKGETIVMLYPAANRDPRKFDRPHSFDVDRDFKNRVMSFGIGRHVCVGAHLARLETRVVLEEVLRRMPDYEAVSPPEFWISNFIRGIRRFDMRWTPGSRSA
jgi:cytochrome P450 family 142 subfamily A polypeptide 1